MKSSLNLPLALLSLSWLAACGNAAHTIPAAQFESLMPDGSNIQGTYSADLYPINFKLEMPKIGSVGLNRKEDNFATYVSMQNGSPGEEHHQDIYLGSRCPGIQDDTIHVDGYIDMEEAQRALGGIIIPLDGDLDSQSSGRNDYPWSNNAGEYLYEQHGSFHKMFEDLKNPSRNPEDNYVTLGSNDGLGLVGKVILISSKIDSTAIPEYMSKKLVPIACGFIMKVDQLPPEFHDTSGSSSNTDGQVSRPNPPTTSTPTTTTSPTPSPSTTSRAPDSSTSTSSSWSERIRRWWHDTWDGSSND